VHRIQLPLAPMNRGQRHPRGTCATVRGELTRGRIRYIKTGVGGLSAGRRANVVRTSEAAPGLRAMLRELTDVYGDGNAKTKTDSHN